MFAETIEKLAVLDDCKSGLSKGTSTKCGDLGFRNVHLQPFLFGTPRGRFDLQPLFSWQ